MAAKSANSRRPYDLVVIGKEAAGLAAAACAARQGARTALISTGASPRREISAPVVPDFVWRRLDLQETGLDARPAGPRVSLLKDGRDFATFSNRRKTDAALAEGAADEQHLWADFQAGAERMNREEGELLHRASLAAAKRGKGPLMNAITGADGHAAAARLTQTAGSLIEDYFENDALRTHLANTALTPLGLGGDEPGSSMALASLMAPSSWRVRTNPRGPSLERALEDRCAAAGVDMLDAQILDIQPSDDKLRMAILDNGDSLRSRLFMAASAAAAAEADLPLAASLAPLTRRDGALADVRLRFSQRPAPPTEHKDAVYYLSDGMESLRDARDASLEGRFPERPPIIFEFGKDEIVVRAPYCPSVLTIEGETREWTEQDRQAFGRQIVSRLAPYLNGGAQSVRRVDVKITLGETHRTESGHAAVIAPQGGHDPIGAAARLAMDLVSDG